MNQKFSAIAMISSAVAASALFSIVTLANPPSGAPGTTSGAIAATSTGGFWSVTINGTTTIQKTLDMAGNRIMNVATPVTSTDAVNKSYVDAPTKLWGEGKANIKILNAANNAELLGTDANAGECTIGTIRAGRSLTLSSWNDAQSACPSNWWVCSAAERGSGACGSLGAGFGDCFINTASGALDAGGFGHIGGLSTSTFAWVADRSTAAFSGNGQQKGTGGGISNQPTCSQYPVWCCKQL